jgi:hypothetical protein
MNNIDFPSTICDELNEAQHRLIDRVSKLCIELKITNRHACVSDFLHLADSFRTGYAQNVGFSNKKKELLR